jgi:radical SAM superfamily enzyme YgiQ (UPF0313 family)
MAAMRVALLSTYEMGHQPLHLASPAAALQLAGYDVRTLDLAVEDWDHTVVAWADAIALSVPMHTALRLATLAAQRIRSDRPDVPLAAFGLYAASADLDVVDRAIAGEYEPELLAWIDSISSGLEQSGATTSRGRTHFTLPFRDELPPLSAYARLVNNGHDRLVGAVEASHGCLHLCRHCPLPTVYNGRFRAVDREVVLADIAQLVDLGAEHITFSDPDFFNGPKHSMRLVEQLHERWPHLSFDATIKVEHLVSRRQDISTLVEAGCLFIVSAFESLNDDILEILDKGHTAAQSLAVVHHAQDVGLQIRPTWLPFTPWSDLSDVADIFSFIAAHDLIGATDPVQLSIRLLVPETSLLANHDAFLPHRRDYDQQTLSYRWQSPDPRMDELAHRLSEIAEEGGEPEGQAFSRMWAVTLEAAGQDPGLAHSIPQGATAGRPRLTEPWFC